MVKFNELLEDLKTSVYGLKFVYGDASSRLLESNVDWFDIHYNYTPLFLIMNNMDIEHPDFIKPGFTLSEESWDFTADIDDNIISLVIFPYEGCDIEKLISMEEIYDVQYVIELDVEIKKIKESWTITGYRGWIRYEYTYTCDDEDNLVFGNVKVERK